MPTVPVTSHPLPTEQTSTPQATVSPYNPEEVRHTLAQEVQKQVSKTGTVSSGFLDQFAVSHLEKSAVDTPAAWDYAALRDSAKREEEKQQHQQQLAQLDQEAAWTKQVGVLTADNAALETYLSVQLPVYQAHLQQSGISEEQSVQAGKRLRAQTVAQHISRSLAGGDWHTAQQVLHAQGSYLSDEVRQRCEQQVHQQAVHDTASRLWQRVWQESDSNVTLAKQQATSHLQDVGEELRQPIAEEINRLAAQQQRQSAAAQADVFSRLAYADTVQMQRKLLTSQTVLDTSQLAAAEKAMQLQDLPATPAQQNWFVNHYFQEDTDAEKALDKGWCNARDYFRLKSAQQAHQSGENFPAEQWLCCGIQTWMNTHGFSTQDITRVSYAVLCGAPDNKGRLARWQQIKTLLTC